MLLHAASALDQILTPMPIASKTIMYPTAVRERHPLLWPWIQSATPSTLSMTQNQPRAWVCGSFLPGGRGERAVDVNGELNSIGTGFGAAGDSVGAIGVSGDMAAFPLLALGLVWVGSRNEKKL